VAPHADRQRRDRIRGYRIVGRTVVILQPSYLPWLGYFEQLHRSDVFVVYDDVQYDKESWRNRNRIRTPRGAEYLTVPVLTSGRNWPLNRDVEIDQTAAWTRKHLGSLRQNYAKAPYFTAHIDRFERLYARKWKFLLDLNLACLETLTCALGLRREIRLASDLEIPGKSTERLVAICQSLGATHYYNGAAGASYIDAALFEKAGITLEYQDYRHPVYSQLFEGFVPYLSVVDLLFNCGPRSLPILLAAEPQAVPAIA